MNIDVHKPEDTKVVCANCKQKIKDKDAFCPHCGKSSPRRDTVFEVIVRQAIAKAPWRQICRSAMEENKITEEDILKEVESRGFKRDDLSKK